MTTQTFRDPEGSNRVGLIIESVDIDVLKEAMGTEEAAEAMKGDGVRPETLLLLVEA